MKTLRVPFSSLMLVNMIKKNILNFLIAVLACLQGALEKKQLTASSVEHVKGCVRYIFVSLFLSLKEGTCEARKNVFYFTSKALFVLGIIKF